MSPRDKRPRSGTEVFVERRLKEAQDAVERGAWYEVCAAANLILRYDERNKEGSRLLALALRQMGIAAEKSAAAHVAKHPTPPAPPAPPSPIADVVLEAPAPAPPAPSAPPDPASAFAAAPTAPPVPTVSTPPASPVATAPPDVVAPPPPPVVPRTGGDEHEAMATRLEQTGRPMEAAVQWCRAALRQRESGHQPKSVEALRRAEALLASIPAGPGRDQLELEILIPLAASETALRGFDAPEVGSIHERAQVLCERTRPGPLLFAALGALSRLAYNRGDFEGARALAGQHRDAVRQASQLNRLCTSHTTLGHVAYKTGQLDKAREELEVAVTLYETHGRSPENDLNPVDAGIAAIVGLATVLSLLGHFDLAQRRVVDSLERANHPAGPMNAMTRSYVHAGVARTLIYLGALDDAVAHGRHAVQIAAEQRDASGTAFASLMLGAALAEQGDAKGAIEMLGRHDDNWRAAGFALYLPVRFSALARAHAADGDLDEALSLVDDALAHANAFGERVYISELYRLRGEILHVQAAAGASEAFARSLTTAHAQGARLFELRAATSLHRLHVAGGTRRAIKNSRERLSALYDTFAKGLETADVR